MGALPQEPPFVFRAVTTRVFPLKANMARLWAFCDQYLNMDIPARIARFRPSLPYVYLMVLNYGSMSAASVKAQNVGWVSQHEVTFTVPLEWWREEDGKLVFKDWACVSPFIFVDDELSLTTGREVYGWPKVMARVDADIPLWTTHPQGGERLFSLSSYVFPKVYAGQAEASRVLLQIDRAAAPTYAVFPPDPDNPWAPLSSLADAARASFTLMGDAVDMMLGARIRGYRMDRSADSIRAMLGKAGGTMAHLLPALLLPGRAREESPSADGSPQLSIEQITLKQFRSAEDPNDACYQALVTSRMGFDRLNGTGLLGDLNLLRGDPTGGFTVRIHRYPSQPIIESLGLEVAGHEDDGAGGSVAMLKPTLPFWTDVDLYYGKGRVICSRTSGCASEPGHNWVDEQDGAETPRPPTAGVKPSKNQYNTVLGAATQPICGPFTFPDVTQQVFPLLADRAQLERFVESYANAPLSSTGLRFEPFGSYVYMQVNVFGDQLGTMWSSTNNIGWWAEREVIFSVPVKWYKDGELVSLALLTPFVYANNGRAVITDREVNGRPSVAATIERPPDAWLTRSGPAEPRTMLRLAAEVFPALNLRQKAEHRTLLEIDGHDVLPYNADVGWRMVAQTWGRQLVDDLKRKAYERARRRREVDDAKALAFELFAHGLPVNSVVFKQYRDAADVDRACYQAAVHTTRSITSIYDMREIEQAVHVRIRQFPGHPIVEALGLVVKSVDSIDGSVVQNLQPIRPFWMRIGVKEELGKVIAWRAADEAWTVTHPWFREPPPQPQPSEAVPRPQPPDAVPYFRAPGETHVGPGLLGKEIWRNLKEEASQWLRESLVDELAWMRGQLQALPGDARAAFRERLATPMHKEQLDRLLVTDSFPAFCDALSIDGLIDLARAVVGAGLVVPPLDDAQAAGSPDSWRRLTHADAKRTIESLDEVQVVVESILSDEWENWGDPRRDHGKRKPEQSVPVSSVYGGTWALRDQTNAFEREYDLRRFDDSWWYYVYLGDSEDEARREP
jgi:hypothetical protein